VFTQILRITKHQLVSSCRLWVMVMMLHPVTACPVMSCSVSFLHLPRQLTPFVLLQCTTLSPICMHPGASPTAEVVHWASVSVTTLCS
jgi:hypothetical protein